MAFLHIMKTGGTSYNQFITNHLDTKGHPLPNTWDGVFRAVRNSKTPEIPVRAISGHFLIGDTLTHFPNAQVATLLRQPSDRLLSLYRYLSSMDEINLRQMDENSQKVAVSARELEPIEWIRKNLNQIQTQVSNVYVYTLSATYADLMGMKPVEDFIEVAQENLKKLAFVGITENMRDNILLTALTNGLNTKIEAPALNITPSLEGNASNINADNSLEPFLAYDWMLYRLAKRIFRRRLQQTIQQALVRISAQNGGNRLIKVQENVDTFLPFTLDSNKYLERAICYHSDVLIKSEAERDKRQVVEFWLPLRPASIRSITIDLKGGRGTIPDVGLRFGSRSLKLYSRSESQLHFSPSDGTPMQILGTSQDRTASRFKLLIPAAADTHALSQISISYA